MNAICSFHVANHHDACTIPTNSNAHKVIATTYAIYEIGMRHTLWMRTPSYV